MFNMKLKATRETVCNPCAETEERYPCVYFDLPPDAIKTIKSVDLGAEVRVTLVASVKGLTLRNAEDSYNGSAGSIDLEVRKMDLRPAGNEFGEMIEDD